MKKLHQQAFTLMELLVIILIIAVLAAGGAAVYGGFHQKTQLTEITDQIIQTIRTARERSAARLHNSSHGVYFEINPGDDRYILYEGASYATRVAVRDRAEILENALSFLTTLANDEVNFSKGLGVPNNTGTVTLTHSAGGTKTITINSFGLVEE